MCVSTHVFPGVVLRQAKIMPVGHPSIDELIKRPRAMPEYHPAVDPWLSWSDNSILSGPADQ